MRRLICEEASKENILYLLTSGGLNEYLICVDEWARDMFSRLVKEYVDRLGGGNGKIPLPLF